MGRWVMRFALSFSHASLNVRGGGVLCKSDGSTLLLQSTVETVQSLFFVNKAQIVYRVLPVSFIFVIGAFKFDLLKQ